MTHYEICQALARISATLRVHRQTENVRNIDVILVRMRQELTPGQLYSLCLYELEQERLAQERAKQAGIV